MLPLHVPGAALHVRRPAGLRAGLPHQAAELGRRQESERGLGGDSIDNSLA